MRFLLLILLLLPLIANSYTINRGIYGEELYWPSNTQSVRLNTSNSSLINSATLSSILNSSSSEFSKENFNFLNSTTTAGPSNGVNDIYFTGSTSVFGGGSSVLGITKVSFEQSSGKILEADILLNDIVFFSSTQGVGNFIGDVITHELGHFAGLGHSETHGSTMFYTLNSGQSTLGHDDLSGIGHLYSSSSSEITGVIKGGDSVGVFGAHVQAISSIDGEIAASTVSEPDGSFVLSNLNQNTTYYIFIEELNSVSNLPDFYKTVKNNFCLSEESYRGTFYQSCRRSEEGRPQGVSTGTKSSVSVGVISIGCDLSVPVSYMLNKGGGTNEIDIVDVNGYAGDALTGFFSETEVTLNTADEFEVDLQDYTVPSGDIYLDIKLVYQKLYSPLRLTLSSMTETINFDSSADIYGLRYDSDNNPDIDEIGRIKLDSVSSNNVFKFSVTPEKISDFVSSKPFSVGDFYPSETEFQDDMYFYLVIMTISKKVGSEYIQISEKVYNLQDNSSCLDAPRTYAVSESSQVKSVAAEELEKRKNQSDPEIISCGTVGGGGGPGGPSTFILAFVFGLLFSQSSRISRLLQM